MRKGFNVLFFVSKSVELLFSTVSLEKRRLFNG